MCMGLKTGKTLQNLLSAAKVLGLAGLLVAGLGERGRGSRSGRREWSGAGRTRPVSGPGFGLAMILVLYAYGGWNDAVFVAADVREPKRNMPRALVARHAADCRALRVWSTRPSSRLSVLRGFAVRERRRPTCSVCGWAIAA